MNVPKKDAFVDLFRELAAPFEPGEVKARTQAGRTLHYITARTAMNRLDEVVGPHNWWDEFSPHENSVVCRLTIRLPDGQELTKVDAGGYAGMSDQGDDDKSGYSDAFKRACVKFGVGRYLYRDGVPDFVHGGEVPASREPEPERRPAPTGNGNGREYGPPTNGSQLFAWAKEQSGKFDVDVVKWLDRYAKTKGLPGSYKEWSSEEIKAGHAAAVAAMDKQLAGA